MGTEGLPARLVPVRRSSSGGAILRRRKASKKFEVRILDVSMSGASVVARSSLGLAHGHRVEVHLDGDRHFVGRVIRVVPTEDRAWVHYGIVYLEITPPYQDWLNDQAARSREEVTEQNARRAN
jgi:hypothetical protein